ncbi:hypothetical protein KJZ63_02210 [Patescibacteria group bacterium]|nr:hypothetical protein [Patescibacteria group bacterium]
MKSIKLLNLPAKFFLLIFGLVIFYFGLLGFTTGPWEGDSLAYHLPLATELSKGNFGNYSNLLYYYPASVHLILALFMVINLPLQLFNVLGLMLLFVSVYWLGRRLNLLESNAVVFGVSVALLTPMARLITTQTVDIYLATIYATLLGLLLKPQKSWQYFSLVGLLSGLLVGAKYTGPLFLVGLALVFFWSIKNFVTKKSLLLVLVLTILFGGIWYLRNWLWQGDPIYPAHHPSFTWVNWHTWQTIFQAQGGAWYFVESLLSEYLFWPVFGFLAIYVAIKRKLEPIENKLTLLFLGNFSIHLLIPASINNVLSDLRYAAPTFICLLAVIFVYMQRKRLEMEVYLLSLISVLASFSLIMPHRPKVFVLYGLMVFVGWLLTKLLKQKANHKG